jgi:hypothetical protein
MIALAISGAVVICTAHELLRRDVALDLALAAISR